MLAIAFLLISFLMGRRLYACAFRARIANTLARGMNGLPVPVAPWLIEGAAAWVTGLLALGWVTYLGAGSFQETKDPLAWGNGVALVVMVPVLWFARSRKTAPLARLSPWAWGWLYRWEVLLTVLLLGWGAWLMTSTLWLRDATTLEVGLSVFSDFGPHLSVIRSFSLGANFPTEYPHFPAGDIRYHFLFQFLAGNLEYLGLPIDWAFNVPSILGVVCCGALLFALATALTGRRAVGWLTVALFWFRSAPAFLDFFRGVESWAAAWEKFRTIDVFIGRTEHEDWGLFNQNVYMNQRHLAFGMAVLWLLLLVVLPLVRASFWRPGEEASWPRWRRWWNGFVSAEAWLPANGGEGLRASLGAGLLLGALCYWNGAVVITALLILFFAAIGARHRLEFLILAVLTAGAGMVCNRLFLGPDAVPMDPSLRFGFLAKHPITWPSVLEYHWDLLGFFWIVLGLALIWSWVRVWRALPTDPIPRGVTWWLILALMPLGLANSLQLTPEIGINHKYIMVAVALLNIWVAWVVTEVARVPWVGKLVAGVAMVALTATGLLDLRTLVNRNTPDKALIAKFDDPLHLWAKANTPQRSIFLTDWYSTHPVLLAGRRIYYGWPYYAWSAGYDTLGREAIVKQIYGATDPKKAQELARAQRIDYIVIDEENRRQSLYTLQERVLREAFHVAYARDSVVVLKVE